jgi:hypothetical protein
VQQVDRQDPCHGPVLNGHLVAGDEQDLDHRQVGDCGAQPLDHRLGLVDGQHPTPHPDRGGQGHGQPPGARAIIDNGFAAGQAKLADQPVSGQVGIAVRVVQAVGQGGIELERRSLAHRLILSAGPCAPTAAPAWRSAHRYCRSVAPQRRAASATAASRAVVASQVLSVRSRARKRRVNARDLRPSPSRTPL